MGVSGGPYIVRDSSLVLELDAADRNSYPGSGTIWRDLTANNNSGSLVNGPTFNSANGGSIMFDGSNNYINCGNNSVLQITSGSISSWVKTTNAGLSYRGIITKQQNYGLLTFDNILVAYDWGNLAQRSTGINIADGTWKNVAMTFTTNTGTPSNNANIYLNGVLVLTTTIKYFDNAVRVEISRGGTVPSGDNQFFNGFISNAQIYNRALSATEVLQNYNATKTRFGL